MGVWQYHRRSALTALLAFACLGAAPPTQRAPGGAQPGGTQPDVTRAYAEIAERLPHDADAFTEGLLIHDGDLFESTGRESQSTITRRDLKTGAVKQSVRLPPRQFGEGIAIWRDQLLNVTWHGNVGERRQLGSLKTIGRFSYAGEGWGMTYDGHHIILSDGTPVLRFLNPATMRVVKRLPVTYRGRPLTRINELEFVDGSILANVWLTHHMVRIDPASGAVTQLIDLSALVEDANPQEGEAVPNGIAYDAGTKQLYATGKLWPILYRITIVPGERPVASETAAP